MRRIGIVGLIGFAALLGGATLAQADVNASLQTMFNKWGMAAATRPGAYQSQAQGALTGGSLSLRVPDETFRLVSVAPPRFRMGCGGIDLYLGSISFPSLSRFTDLLQQLGTAGVAGFAFQMAMTDLCPTCRSVLDAMEAAARAINNAGRLSPCQMGQELAKAVQGQPSEMTNVVNTVGNVWQNVKEWTGQITDYWADRDTAANQTTADAAANMAGTPNEIRGNLVYKSLVDAGWSDDDARMIMSVTGTLVVADEGVVSLYPPILSMADLIVARQNSDEVPIYLCSNDLCLYPDDSGRTNEVDGFRHRAEAIYQQIVEKVMASKEALSPEEEDLINRSAIPFYRLIVDYANTPAKAEVIKNDISELLGMELAHHWVDWAHREARKQASTLKQRQPNFVASMEEFDQQISRQLQILLAQYQAKLAALGTAQQYTTTIQQTMKKAPINKKKMVSK